MDRKRIFVGLSGGVDSAVTAALLKEAGQDVVGVFIKAWYPPGLPCSWATDRRDAMRVAARLSIPFATLDASAEYKKAVIDYLLSEYKKGNTPNPDVMCNREVKFGAFHAFAKKNGADCIATGHYARAEEGRLYRGVDAEKDQSYFLWAVPEEALAMTLFPLGEKHKVETRTLAKRFDLPVAEKRDSQGICFLGNVSMEEFLASKYGHVQGKAIDEKGNEIGTHDGALFVTLGERVRLHDAEQGPWYVVSKDVANNTLTVGHESKPRAKTDTIRLTETNLFRNASGVVTAQLRYHGPKVSGTFDAVAHTFTPHDALTESASPGQSLVLYDHDECVGGGIISE